MEYIKLLAKKFRDAIECAKENGERDKLHFFLKFPRGCCGDASDLLAKYLSDNGIKTFQIRGDYFEPTPQSHTWLSTEDNIIIDITGDQFSNNVLYDYFDIPVYVGLESDFHKKFQNRNYYRNTDFDVIDNTAKYQLNDLYQKIMKYI